MRALCEDVYQMIPRQEILWQPPARFLTLTEPPVRTGKGLGNTITSLHVFMD
jgi:hypothetical protein